jgi:DNA adenine methylase
VAKATVEIRPFLKWAGGKRQLLPHLRACYPARFATYFEPFLGSGAVFFDLWASRRLEGRRACLTDLNADLIGCYVQLRDQLEEVVNELEGLARGHARRGVDHYYEVRDGRFNPARQQWRAAGGGARAYTPALAAMLIYLNRTGYNGLFRQNARGDLNVPAGHYRSPRIVDRELLHLVSQVLNGPNVEIAEAPFDMLLERAATGDFVYFDPPYAPVSATAAFRSYTAAGFRESDHVRLQRLVVTLASRGVHVLLSNSVAPQIVRLYQDSSALSAGLQAWRVPARRAINSRATLRGPIEELLVATSSSPRRQQGRSAGVISETRQRPGQG